MHRKTVSQEGRGMYTDMDQWTDIRFRVLRRKESKRKILRETGMHWRTLVKILQYSEPPGVAVKRERPKPKIGPFLDRIADILESDKEVPKKQRHAAKRIYERIEEEGYQGKYTQVKEAVSQIKGHSREVFMPLIHQPGEAHVDFGEALAKVSGVLRKVHFLVMALPYSDAFFVVVFERECTWWEGHVRAFEFFRGVPGRITYDSSRVLASTILYSRWCKLTKGFLQLKSHYLFDHHFCRVRRANEKGLVEGVVKYVRLNFFVPVPQVRDLEELNERLAQMCQDDLTRRRHGKSGTKAELLAEDIAAFHTLPIAPFDACRKQSTTANPLSPARFDDNDFTLKSDLCWGHQGCADLQWMVRVIQGIESRFSIAQTVDNIEGLPTLIEKARNGRLRDRNRALTVLARFKGVAFSTIANVLNKSEDQVRKYWTKYEQGGVKFLFRGWPPRERRAHDQGLKDLFFSILHAPPSEYNINRTSWKIDDLKECLRRKGNPASKDVIRELIRNSGFRWKSAKVVLTSNDPDYRAKLENITSILSSLGPPNDRFCSIDEYGPFAVNMKGGVKLAGPDETPYVQQFQKSKGCIIMTAALELSQNQITHFYSDKKNTAEMLRMLAVLLEKYKGCGMLYMSWDAASWHDSKALYREIDKVNSADYRALNGTPIVKVAPLPSRAQFLNVIESVFSGMARAIIHNSDYQSVAEAKAAIDRYFAERNEHFRLHPKRAGRKIWGQERVASEFSQGNNCKGPRYR
jgi:transposase